MNNITNKIRNFIILPCLAILLSMALYLSLVFYSHKIFLSFPKAEEYLWNYFVKDKIDITQDKRQKSIQFFVDNIPDDLLPTRYNKIQIIISSSNEINAYSAPGGRVILTKGLLDKLTNNKALVFVIGHEIGHLQRGDHLYEFSRSMIAKTYKLFMGYSIFEELLLVIDNGKIKQAEFIADKKAFDLLKHYYDGQINIEEIFYILPKHYDSSILSTHPTTEERIHEIMKYSS